jgi:crotonobetainyl-CoA:carnitine CoA-transferase CaiB-like acyl-CoA transferase
LAHSRSTEVLVYDVLEGVRVVEVAAWLFAPSCGAILADWGAEVLKIEPTTNGGDPYRGFFHNGPINPTIELANRGKRSVALDLSSAGGHDALLRVVSDADVFITSMLPRVQRRLRITPDDIRSANPSVIYVRATGYGPRGPDAETPGYDAAVVWARGGFADWLTPPDADDPIPPPGGIGDCVGGLTMAGAVAAALYKRERSGRAPTIDVSLLASALWMNATVVMAHANPGPNGPLFHTRDRLSPPNPLSNNYRTADGRWIALVVIQPDPHWRSFCEHLGRLDLFADPHFVDFHARMAHAHELVEILDAEFATRTVAEWRQRLEGFTGVWDVNQSPAELVDDPQVVANGYLPQGDEGGPSMRAVASPVQFDALPLGPVRRAPAHGADTDETLMDAGYSRDEIVEMKVSGALF